MGVKGLWQLLSPVGQPVALESLEGKILAIDVSIWLNKAAKGMRDGRGNQVYNAHLVLMFHRICKLLFYGVKPVFVFDGGVPELKKKTLKARKQQRLAAETKKNKTRDSMLKNYLQAKAIETVTGEKSKIKLRLNEEKSEDLFQLNPIDTSSSTNSSDSDTNFETEVAWLESLKNEHIQNMFDNPELVDIESEEFKFLSPEIQHELLTEIKNSQRRRYKRKKKTSYEEFIYDNEKDLPVNAMEFSSYQLANLTNRGKITHKIDSLRKEMNSSLATQFLQVYDDSFLKNKNKYISTDCIETKKMASDAHTSCVLIKKKSKEENPLFQTTLDDDYLRFKQKESYSMHHEEFQKLQRTPAHFETIKNNNKSLGGRFFSDESSDEEKINFSPTSTTHFMTEQHKILLDEKSDSYCAQDVNMKNKVVTLDIGTLTNTHTQQDTAQANIEFMSTSDDDSDDSFNTNAVKSDKADETKEIGSYHQSIIIDTSVVDGACTYKEIRQIDECTDQTETNFEQSAGDSGDLLSSTTILRGKEADVASVEEQIKLSQNLSNEVKNNVTTRNEFREAEDILSEKCFPQVSSVQKHPVSSGIATSPFLCAVQLDNVVALQKDLEDKQTELEQHTKKQTRLAATVTYEKYKEVQELLHLFQLPYIVSPMEAEAQCAQLDYADLTDGTVTDDSDIFLFGGRIVYKNIFNQKKYAEVYKSNDIETTLFLTRQMLIALAFLTGSDYTDGISGIGGVSGMEVLHEFSQSDPRDTLDRIKEWLSNPNKTKTFTPGSKVAHMLKRATLSLNFNSPAVWDAYTKPTVDNSEERFEWGTPDIDGIKEFANTKFGWLNTRTEEALKPVLAKMNQRKKSQKTLDMFLTHRPRLEERKVKSKRLKRIIELMSNPDGSTAAEVSSPDKELKILEKVDWDSTIAIHNHRPKSRKIDHSNQQGESASSAYFSVSSDENTSSPRKYRDRKSSLGEPSLKMTISSNERVQAKKMENLEKVAEASLKPAPPYIRIQNLNAAIHRRLHSRRGKANRKTSRQSAKTKAVLESLDRPQPLVSSESDSDE